MAASRGSNLGRQPVADLPQQLRAGRVDGLGALGRRRGGGAPAQPAAVGQDRRGPDLRPADVQRQDGHVRSDRSATLIPPSARTFRSLAARSLALPVLTGRPGVPPGSQPPPSARRGAA